MESVNDEIEIIERALNDCATRYRTTDARLVPLFDRLGGQFALIEEGWIGYRRLYNPIVHVERTPTLVRILADYTEHGIAHDLIAAGIAAVRIELTYKHPSLRTSPIAV